MCDIWFTKIDNPNPGGYNKYEPVDVTEDGIYELCSKRMDFFVLRLPGLAASKVKKYLEADEVNGSRRKWRVRGADLPAALKTKLINDGHVVVKAGSYDGEYQYTWPQIKSFFRNKADGVDEVEDL